MNHPEVRLSAEHTRAVNRTRRIINQEDANEPVEALGMDIDRWLDHRFDLMAAEECQIDTVAWDIGLMEDSYSVYDSEFLPPVDYHGLAKWRKQGVNWVDALVGRCHQLGIEAWWNARISEVDAPQPFVPCPHDDPRRQNYLKQQHPDWTLQCWWPQGLWNLASPGLREHKLKVLRELLEKHDLDGLQLDFARHTPCLPPGKEWQMRDCITEFVRMVRFLLLELEQKKGKPLLLSVRVAETIPGCHMDGMEVDRWAAEQLVDIFTLGGRTSTVDVASFREITEGTNIKICPQFDGHHTNDGYYGASTEYLRGVFANWQAQGADSVGVFNWTCAREEAYDLLGLPPVMKSAPQKQMLFEAGSAETMAGKSKQYAVERKGGYPWAGNYLYRNDNKPLPFTISALTNPLPLYVYEDVSEAGDIDTIELAVVLSPILSAEAVQVDFNGTVLACNDADPNWKDGQIYGDKPQPSAGAVTCYGIDPEQQLTKLYFPVPADIVTAGQNIINVKLRDSSAATAVTVEKVELTIAR